MTKLNVDVAISKDFLTLAVVSRNAIGEIIKAWAKVHFASNALQVEATTILWALKLTNSKKFSCIIVEGDSKICCYALNNRDSEVAWCVSSVLFNILECRKSFSSCSFVWRIILRYPHGYCTSKWVTCYSRLSKHHINGTIITFDGTNIIYDSTFITLFSTFIHFIYDSTFITIMVPGTNITYDGNLHHIQ